MLSPELFVKPNPHSDCIRRRGLCRGGRGRGATMNEIIKDAPESCLAPSAREDAAKTNLL